MDPELGALLVLLLGGSPDFDRTRQSLLEDLQVNKKLPKRISWDGTEHDSDEQDLV
jgi:hypothetical protein